MGLFGLLKGLWSKKLTVKEIELDNFFVTKLNLKKNIAVNTTLVVPENSVCVASLKGKPCDTLKTGEYQLNANSLPILFKKGKYNKLNKYGVVPSHFSADFYFVSLCDNIIEFDVGKYKIKDICYGKQYVNMTIRIDFRLNDAIKFFKLLLYEHPKVKKEKVLSIVSGWFASDIVSYMKKRAYNIDDYMSYTRGFNADLNQILKGRFIAMGLEVVETILLDIILSDKLIRDITENRSLSLQVHSQINDFDAFINEDGVISGANVVKDEEQTKGSIAEGYASANSLKNIEDVYNETYINENLDNLDNAQKLEYNGNFFSNLNSDANNCSMNNSFGNCGEVLCPNCHRSIPDYATFCPYCASRMNVSVKICPNCGASNSADSMYCYNCGNTL